MRSAPLHALGSYLRGRPRPLPNGPGTSDAWVALVPDAASAAALAARATLPAAALQVRVATLRAAGADELGLAREALAALRLPAVSGETARRTSTSPSGARGVDVVGDALGHLRDGVVRALASAGVPVVEGPWRAHMVLDLRAGVGAPEVDVPRVPVVFADLWLFDAGGAREPFSLGRPERAERVATARSARLRREALAEAAGRRPGWKGTRHAIGWHGQVDASAEHIARLERSYGMVPPEEGPSLPSASSLAPGLAPSRPLPCDPAWGTDDCRELVRAARAVHAVSPLVTRFPAARAAVRDAVERVARSGGPPPAYDDAQLEHDAEGADAAARLALSAVRHLAAACAPGVAVVRGHAAAAVRDARDAADFARAMAQRPPVDFAAALRTDRIQDNPHLFLPPDPTPAEAVEAVTAMAKSRSGHLMLPGRGQRPDDPGAGDVRLWVDWDIDPRATRARAEVRYARAVAGLLRQARQVARSGVAPEGWNPELNEAREAISDLAGMRAAEMARAAGLASPAVAAYERLVAAGRARRAALEAEVAALQPPARAALERLAGRLEEIGRAGADAPIRARLAAYAAALRGRFNFYLLVILYQGYWWDAGPEGEGTRVGPKKWRDEGARLAFHGRFSDPVRRAARDAMRNLRDVAEPLDRARAKLKMLAEPQLLADPWHATYATPATMVNSYAHVFAGAAT